MNRAALLLTALLCLASPAAAPRAAAAQLNYTLYVLAVPLGDAVFSVDLGAPTYRAALRFRTTGLVDTIARDRLEQHTSGRFENDRPAPIEYGANSRLRGQDRVIGLTWRDGTPVVTAITPPNETEREDVPVSLLPHTIDPLSGIVLLLRQVALIGRCEATSRGYDGRRLSVLEARTAGEEDLPPSRRSSFVGRALRCDFTDQTLAGFRLGALRDKDTRQRRGTVWLSQVFPGGPRLPVRASLETPLFGDATLYLKAAAP